MPLHRAGTFAFHSSVLPWHMPEPKAPARTPAEPAELRLDCDGSGSRSWAFVLGTAARFEATADVPHGHLVVFSAT